MDSLVKAASRVWARTTAMAGRATASMAVGGCSGGVPAAWGSPERVSRLESLPKDGASGGELGQSRGGLGWLNLSTG